MSTTDRSSRTPFKVDIDNITPTTPLRLETAARIAFPDGSMTLRGLRREAARGRLAIEVIAGKHYTTLSDIEDMRRLCRVQTKAAGAKSSQRAGLSSSEIIRKIAGTSPAEETRSLLQARLSQRLLKKRKQS